jgi:hypothetical protein
MLGCTPGSAAAFETALNQVKTIGSVTSLSTSGEDVTEEYVDLNAQKTALQNQLAQYNKILAKAEKVEDILNVQVQIERVQVELDRIEGRLKYLNNRVDLSTITVNLQEPAPIGGGISFDLNSVINDAIGGFLGLVGALIILFFALLPLIVIGLVAYGIYGGTGRKPRASQEPVIKRKSKNNRLFPRTIRSLFLAFFENLPDCTSLARICSSVDRVCGASCRDFGPVFTPAALSYLFRISPRSSSACSIASIRSQVPLTRITHSSGWQGSISPGTA